MGDPGRLPFLLSWTSHRLQHVLWRPGEGPCVVFHVPHEDLEPEPFRREIREFRESTVRRVACLEGAVRDLTVRAALEGVGDDLVAEVEGLWKVVRELEWEVADRTASLRRRIVAAPPPPRHCKRPRVHEIHSGTAGVYEGPDPGETVERVVRECGERLWTEEEKETDACASCERGESAPKIETNYRWV